MAFATPKMVLIDLDGTLIDSVPDLAFCIDEMMKALGRAPWGEARVREWVGNGVERLVKRALLGRLDGEPDAADYERAYPIFDALYTDNNSRRSVLFPGVRAGLELLRAAGITTACVTNKAARFTEPMLRELGIADYFALVVSGDTLPTKKPDPGQLLHAAHQLGASPAESLMIGDSVNDVQAARAAGFSIVCVPYGYNHGRDIREAAPDAVIETLADLTTLFSPA